MRLDTSDQDLQYPYTCSGLWENKKFHSPTWEGWWEFKIFLPIKKNMTEKSKSLGI